jgi:hypothetical protein
LGSKIADIILEGREMIEKEKFHSKSIERRIKLCREEEREIVDKSDDNISLKLAIILLIRQALRNKIITRDDLEDTLYWNEGIQT